MSVDRKTVLGYRTGVMAPDKRKQTGAHFTPKPLADLVAQRLVKQMPRLDGPIRILDPACGDGNLLVAVAEAMPTSVRRRCTLVGIEDDLALTCPHILYHSLC